MDSPTNRGKTKPQTDISCHERKLTALEMSYVKGAPWKSPKNPGYWQNYRLLSKRGPYCWKAHLHNPLKTEVKQAPTCKLLPDDYCSRYATREEMKTPNPATNPSTYSGDTPTRYTGAIVAQNSWEQPTSIWLDLGTTPWDGTHTW